MNALVVVLESTLSTTPLIPPYTILQATALCFPREKVNVVLGPSFHHLRLARFVLRANTLAVLARGLVRHVKAVSTITTLAPPHHPSAFNAQPGSGVQLALRPAPFVKVKSLPVRMVAFIQV